MNHHILISGATGGLGSHLVKECLKCDSISKVHFLYRNKEKIDLLFAKDNQDRIDATFYKGNYSYADYKKYIQEIISYNKIERMTFVITAFSIDPINVIGKLSSSSVENSIKINILEMVSLINILMENKNFELRIINIDSGAAYRPLHGWSIYCASKAFVNMFLKTLKEENPSMKIVTYEPGVMDTSMQKEIRECNSQQCADIDIFRNYYLLGKLNSPNEVASDIVANYILEWCSDKLTGKFNKKQ